MIKTLADVIAEANERTKQELEKAKMESKFKEASIDEVRRMIGAVRTKIPAPIAAVKEHLDNAGEFELYEFLQNCEFWEVTNKNAPNWYQTAGVRPANERIEFYYDKDFLQSLAKQPGELVFLIAHEASHIFRYHQDRQESQNKDGELYNIASDAIINHDIMKTEKIGGWKPNQIEGTVVIPEEFHKEFKEEAKAYYSENMYDWMFKNKGKLKQKPKPCKTQDYYKEGTVVRVKSGPHKDEYRKITEVNKDGTYETEKVDIEEIKKRAKESLKPKPPGETGRYERMKE